MPGKPTPKSTNRGLTRLKDGRWRLYYTDENGNAHRVILDRSATRARDIQASIRTKILEGRFLDRKANQSLTFESLTEKFLAHSRANLKPSTHAADVRCARRWLESPEFKDKLVSEIKPLDIHSYKLTRSQALSRHGGREHGRLVSRREVDLDLSRLKRMFNLAMDWELATSNPAARVKLYHDNDTRRRFLREEEETRLLAAADQIAANADLARAPDVAISRHLGRLIRLAVHTGMRRGEMLGMQWGDIDFENKVIVIPARRAKGKRDRVIPLNTVALSLLSELSRTGGAAGLVFGNSAGRVNQNLERNWRKALQLAELENFRFHDLRHTFASRLVMSGVDLAVVRELLGHQSFEMTLRYAHLGSAHLRRAVAKLESGGE